MDDVIELGGNIELKGVKDLNGGELVILKKILGNYTKRVSENNENFEKFILDLTDKDGNKYKVKGELFMDGKSYSADMDAANLFFTVNGVLEKIDKKLK